MDLHCAAVWVGGVCTESWCSCFGSELSCAHKQTNSQIRSSKLHAAVFSVPLLCSELVGESTLSIQSSEKVTSISLPPAPPYHTLEFQLEVLCIIPSGADRPANERLTNGEVRHRPRSYSHPDTPMTAIDQRVRHKTCFCGGDVSDEACYISLVFKLWVVPVYSVDYVFQ